MTNVQNSSKISPRHLERKAIVYLRQSTEHQVHHNKESQRLQYALVDWAREVGFKQVDVIDEDLGSSASIGAAHRPGSAARAIIRPMSIASSGAIPYGRPESHPEHALRLSKCARRGGRQG